MKKSIFTLVFMAMMGWVSAQSLQFELNGQALANGERIICTNILEWGELQQDMQLRNLTNEAIEVMVQKEEVDIVEGTANKAYVVSCTAATTSLSNNKGNLIKVILTAFKSRNHLTGNQQRRITCIK